MMKRIIFGAALFLCACLVARGAPHDVLVTKKNAADTLWQYITLADPGGDRLLRFDNTGNTVDWALVGDALLDWGTGAGQVSIADLSGSQVSPAVAWDFSAASSLTVAKVLPDADGTRQMGDLTASFAEGHFDALFAGNLSDNSGNPVITVDVDDADSQSWLIVSPGETADPNVTVTVAGLLSNHNLVLDAQGSGAVKTLSSNLDITGNIIVSGSVDGIADLGGDVAANTAKVGVTTEISSLVEDTAPTLGGNLLTSTFGISLKDGSVTAGNGAVFFASDTDVGIMRAGANDMRLFANGGTAQFMVADDGTNALFGASASPLTRTDAGEMYFAMQNAAAADYGVRLGNAAASSYLRAAATPSDAVWKLEDSTGALQASWGSDFALNVGSAVKDGVLVLHDDDAGGDGTITLQAPDALGVAYTLTLPPDDGSAGQQLQTDGAGVLTWAAAGGGGTSVVLDLADDDVDESTALAEIATTNDDTNIFTESAADKLLVAVEKIVPQHTALPASPGTWLKFNHYDGTISAAYTVSALAAGTEGDVILANFDVTSGPVTMTLTTAVNRVGVGTAQTVLEFDNGPHMMRFFYRGAEWWLADTGSKKEGGIYLGASDDSAIPALSKLSAGVSGALTDETGSGALVFGTSPDFTTGITLNGSAILSGGATASLDNIDAIDATTETTFEAAIDALANLTVTGTIGTGVWQGTAVASAFLDADTAHLSGVQTFTGAKIFADTIALAAVTPNAVGELAYIDDAWGVTTRDAPHFWDGTQLIQLLGTVATDTPTNGQVPKWNTGGTITWEDDNSGGAPTLDTVADPAAATTLQMAATETVDWDFVSFTTGDMFQVRTSGTPSGGRLMSVENSDADVITMHIGDGTNGVQVDNTGSLSAAGTGGIVATTGDSATGFFASGAIEAARGGTGIDSSALTGVARVAAGTWTADATLAHLAASSGQVDDDDLAAGAVDGGAGGEVADDSLTFDDAAHTITLAGDPALAASQAYWSALGLMFEGATANGFEGLLQSADISASDKTWTLPNLTGTIALTNATQTISGANTMSSASNVFTGASYSGSGDTADAGVFRLANAGLVAWEASPAGTDVTLTVNASEQFVFSADILSPTLVTPVLGVASATSVDANSFTADAGAGLDTQAAGALLLGAATATSVEIADTGVTTDVQGDLTVQGTSNKIPIFTESHAAGHTLTNTECFGAVYYVTGVNTELQLPNIEAGMSITVIADSANVVQIAPDTGDVIRRDGTAQAASNEMDSPGALGDIAVLTYHSANTWYAATNSWVDGGAAD